MPYRTLKLLETTHKQEDVFAGVEKYWKMNFLCQSGFNQTLLHEEEEHEIHEDGIEEGR